MNNKYMNNPLYDAEQQILKFWEHINLIQLIEKKQINSSKKRIYYDGPPTANGKPGIHHVKSRVFKDVIPRFWIMNGYKVDRIPGWDCHGLPVELQVEKQIKINSKKDITKYKIDNFNQLCREYALSNIEAFKKMTSYSGYLADYSNEYTTMNNQYIESVWWSIKQAYNKGLLEYKKRIAPYCTRCETTLSNHEVDQGYKEIDDTSIYIKFKLDNENTSFLVWTTTPWTVLANTALAVNPTIQYIKLYDHISKENYIVAKNLAEKLFDQFDIITEYTGKELENKQYIRPINVVNISNTYKILLSDYVTDTDGTGIVHQAPAFGNDDYNSCIEYNLPIINHILENGIIKNDIKQFGGIYFLDSNNLIIDQLKTSSALFKEEQYKHKYPFCWRCNTKLIYYLTDAWSINTTKIKDQLLSINNTVNWYPETIKNGRYGRWLSNNVDWIISRTRYWGTPLPIWKCNNNHITVIESREELNNLSDQDVSQLDLHRPYIDKVSIKCKHKDSNNNNCLLNASRVNYVLDVWYDSGAMPFAQYGYPYYTNKTLNDIYPADYISEGIDQTRGWFYTLMVIAAIVNDSSAYKNVIVLGHILAEDGRKMSKSLGNIVDPFYLFNKYGTDVIRWYMLSSCMPSISHPLHFKAFEEIYKKNIATYWNIIEFYQLYKKVSKYTIQDIKYEDLEDALDKWIMTYMDQLINETTRLYEQYDLYNVTKLLSQAINNISNWYIRLTRNRFWEDDPISLSLLHYLITRLSLLLAPIIPYITEQSWQLNIKTIEEKQLPSIHLAKWPTTKLKIDNNIINNFKQIQEIIILARSLRAQHQLPIKQPLQTLWINKEIYNHLSKSSLFKYIKSEINIKDISIMKNKDSLVDTIIKPNFKKLGKVFRKDIQKLINSIQSINTKELLKSGFCNIKINNDQYKLSIDDLIITTVPKNNIDIITKDNIIIGLDFNITNELKLEYIARNIIRFIQESRKNAKFNISDRIILNWSSADNSIIQSFNKFNELISNETLSSKINKVDIIKENNNIFSHPKYKLTIHIIAI